MSQSGNMPRAVADLLPDHDHAPGLHSPLRELFAPLKQLLTCGGDTRIDIDRATRRNAYGCSPTPSDAAAVSFSSCTASTISQRGYDAAEAARAALMSSAMLHGLIDCFDDRVEAMRGELTQLLDIDDAGIVFTASGTDAQLVALALSRAVLGSDLTTVIAAADQTGTGTIHTARGHHFSARSANDHAVSQGAPIEGLSPVRSIAVRLRDADGGIRASSALDAELYDIVETIVAQDGRVMLETMDCSKLGHSAPSDRCIDEIAMRWPGRVQIVVDACQMRLGRSALADHLARGAIVLITGSKFFTGPPFCGAVLVPRQLLAEVAAKDLARGLGDYLGRSDWPQSLPELRAQFSARPNFGQWLRWEAALAEMRAYFDVPQAFRRSAMHLLGDGLARIIDASPSLDLLPPQPHSGNEFASASIFAFTLRRGGETLSLSQCRAIHAALIDDGASDDAPRILIGQPVGWGGRTDDRFGALRICVSARHITEAFAASPEPSSAALQRVLGEAGTVVGRIEWLLRQR